MTTRLAIARHAKRHTPYGFARWNFSRDVLGLLRGLLDGSPERLALTLSALRGAR